MFRETTQVLLALKECLKKLEIDVGFEHEWFLAGDCDNFWGFFYKYNNVCENREEFHNVNTFFRNYVAPLIKKTE